MIDIREYPKATEWAIDILLEIGKDRKVTAMKRLCDFYRAPLDECSRMSLLEATVVVESAIKMIETSNMRSSRGFKVSITISEKPDFGNLQRTCKACA